MEMKATRDGFGEGLLELGKEDERIVSLSGDLEDSTRAFYFKEAFPNRFFTVGIAEQDMVATAAGLAAEGFIPFVSSFAVFLTNRAYDMIRITVCFNNRNVKLVGSHGGVTVGEDGATAQSLEDIAIMRVLPNMRVIYPVDAIEAKKATKEIAKEYGPFYLRLGRAKFPVITKESDEFIIGKGNIMREGKDVTLIACGLMVSEALKAAELLWKENISVKVINLHTIKPIDEELIVKSAKETGAIVTCEEHQVYGGFGSAVAEVVSMNYPVPIEMVGIKNVFGESGKGEELLRKFHLKDIDIAEAAKRVIKRK